MKQTKEGGHIPQIVIEIHVHASVPDRAPVMVDRRSANQIARMAFRLMSSAKGKA